MTTINENMFDSIDENLLKITKKIETELNNETFRNLNKYVNNLLDVKNEKIKQDLYLFITDVGKSYSKLAISLGSTKFDKVYMNVKKFYKKANPQDIIGLIQKFINSGTLEDEYIKQFNLLKKNFIFPTIIDRYKINSEIFRLYEYNLYKKSDDVLAKVNNFVKSITIFSEYMNNSSIERSKLQSDLALAGRMGSLFAGPIGRYFAKGFVYEDYFDTVSVKDAKYLDGVRIVLNDIFISIDKYCNDLLKCFRLIYLIIYGGLLMKIKKDAETLGYSLNTIKYPQLDIVLALDKSKEKKVEEWATLIIEKTKVAILEKNFSKANNISINFFEYVKANMPISGVVLKRFSNFTIGEVSNFLRVASMLAVLDNAYEMGNKKDAIHGYLRLIKDYNHPNTLSCHGIQVIESEKILIRIINYIENNQEYDNLSNESFTCFIKNNETENLSVSISKAFLNYLGKKKIFRGENYKVNYKEVYKYYKNERQNGFSKFIRFRSKLFYFPHFTEIGSVGRSIQASNQRSFYYSTDKKGKTDLILAVESNNVDKVIKMLMDKSLGGINVKDKEGKTALIYAVEKGNVLMTYLLLKNGAEPSIFCERTMFEQQKTPLVIASGYTSYSLPMVNYHIVKELLEQGANPSQLTHQVEDGRYRYSPLGESCSSAHLNIISLLIKYGAKIKDCTSHTFLIELLFNKYLSDEDVVEAIPLLINAGANINSMSHLGNFTALYWAVEMGRYKVVKELLENGADLKIIYNSGNNVKIDIREVAKKNGHKEIYRLLVNYV